MKKNYMTGFSTIENYFLDILFPANCLMCGKEKEWVCLECLGKIKLLTDQVCPYCEKNITASGAICPHCKEKFIKKNDPVFLDNLLVSTSYRENGISRLIHTYKYNFVSELHIPLGQLMAKSILKNNLPLPDFIIPVPLHPRRLRWRGFNQSELLAGYIARNLTPGMNIPILENFIFRAHYTKPQMKIKSYQARKENMINMFRINNPNGLKDKAILLIDDVATTGATLFECAKILKKHSAKKVFAAVISRQEIPS